MDTLPFQKDYNFKNIREINLKEFKIRKKLDIFISTDFSEKSYFIIYIEQKSRFLQKDANKIEEIFILVSNSLQSNFDNKIIYIVSPLCSKAKKKLEDLGWCCKNIQ